MEFTCKPIGHVQSVFKFKNGTPRQPSVCPDAKGQLTIDKSLYNNPEHSLESLEKFSHVWIIFIFHKNNNTYTKAKVKPPRLNGERVGLFSTRSPYRPNPIGLTLAKLEHIEGATLYLSGIDILDGTPVLDIKPYIPDYDNPGFCPDNSQSKDFDTEDANTTENAEFSRVDHIVDPATKSANSDHQDDTKRKYTENELEPTAVNERSVKCACVNQHSCLSENNNCEFSSSTEHHENNPDSLKTSTPHFTQLSNRSPSLHEDSDDMDENSNVSTQCFFPLNKLIGDSGKITNKSGKKDGTKKIESSSLIPVSSVQVSRNTRHSTACDSNSNAASASETRGGSSEEGCVASWVQNPPTGNLSVVFTPRALEQLGKFNKSSENDDYRLRFFRSANEAMKAISSILKEDPRSIYRRNQCQDKLYFFSVDTIHVTCWFDGNLVEIVRIKPLSQVEQLNSL